MKKTILTCCRAVLMLTVLAWAMPAGAAKNVIVLAPDETINASDIPDNCELYCYEGTCTINMDAEKRIRRIWYGGMPKNKPTLHIKGENMLTISTTSTSTSVSGKSCRAAILTYNLKIEAPYKIVGPDAGIWCEGDCYISSYSNLGASSDGNSVKGKYFAIWASGNVTIDGFLKGEATTSSNDMYSGVGVNYGRPATILSSGGDVKLIGAFPITLKSSSSQGVYAEKGHVATEGKVSITATGAKNPVVVANYFSTNGDQDSRTKITATNSQGEAIFSRGFAIRTPLELTGPLRAVRMPSNTTMTIYNPLAIVNIDEPATGDLVAGVTKTINNKTGNPATYLNIAKPDAITGTLTIKETFDNNLVAPGTKLTFTATGMVKQYTDRNDGSIIKWTRSTLTGETLATAHSTTYNVKESDVDSYIRVTVDLGEDGPSCVQSPAVRVRKKTCTTAVVKPIVELNADSKQIIVTNPQAGQEYLVSTQQAKYWVDLNTASAVTPASGATTLTLSGTTGTTNYVYTRVKATADTYSSDNMEIARIYVGSTNYFQNISLTPKQIMVISSGGTETEQIYDLEPDEDFHNTYYCKVGDKIQITAEPIPANATNFTGILASMWIDNSKNGTFYADAKCTTPLTSGEFYKTVYFKPGKAQNFTTIGAERTISYNNVAHDEFYLHIADAGGNVLISTLKSINVEVDAGKGKTHLMSGATPKKAAFKNLSASLESGSGTAPVIYFSTINGNTYFRVIATQATPGKYIYNVLQNDNKVGQATVTVNAVTLQSLAVYPEEITAAEPGNTYQLEATLQPVNASETVTWTSTNTAVATVDANGLVTIAANADIAATAKIIATAGEFADTCAITVAGEKYNLRIAGVQVTSRNMDEETLSYLVAAEAGDEAMERYFNGENRISFDGSTLTLKNVSIETDDYTSGWSWKIYGIYSNIPDLEIRLVGDNRITGYKAIEARAGVTFTGSGSLNCTTEWGIDVSAPYTYVEFLQVSDSVQITIDASRVGIDGYYSTTGYTTGALYCESPNATLRVRGSEKASIRGIYGIWVGEGVAVLEPAAGIKISRSNYSYGDVIDTEGNVITDWIVFGRDAALKGDVNGDGEVSIADVTTLVNLILGDESTERSDVNGDGETSVADVTSLINIILEAE